MGRVLAIFCSALLGLSTTAAARQLAASDGPPPPATFEIVPLTPDQEAQLTTWLTAVKKWQEYDEKWRNRPVHDGWGRIAERRPSPAAPGWLPVYCASVAAAGLAGFEERTEIACRVLDDPRASFAAVPPPMTARLDAEKPPPHSSFLTRLHFDGMWSTTSTNGRLYGIVGTHMSLVDIGRIQLFGPPGVMLLTVPDGYGGRRVALGYTWGLSIRLGDVRMGAPTKNMTVFLNISKVFLGSADAAAGSSRGYDIVGFSIAPRKRR
jgi:hypothetical protein